MIQSWLHSLLVSGCICSLILFVNPDGKIKNLLETGCACIMVFVFLSPITNLSMRHEIRNDFREWTTIESDNISVDKQLIMNRDFMEAEYQAYILNEAKYHNIQLHDVLVGMQQNSDGYWLPVSVEYITTQTIPESFLLQIANDLGITEERISINEIE